MSFVQKLFGKVKSKFEATADKLTGHNRNDKKSSE